MRRKESALDLIKYYLVPPLFLVFFTWVVSFLSIVGKGESYSLRTAWEVSKGNTTSWIWTSVIVSWAVISLKVPSKLVKGPETSYGYAPVYKANGFEYYLTTLVTFFVIDAIWPTVSSTIFWNFSELLGSLNCSALLLCVFLLIKGKTQPSHPEDKAERHPLMYEFYRGVELHPTAFGLNVKQLTNCRIGLMGWQIFITAFFLTAIRTHGFDASYLVNYLLQTVYIAKFFWWETGYFDTLDMILDRAGYYICWGCLVWVPTLYTYSSYYSVNHRPSLSPTTSWTILILGLISILLNYEVDREKQVSRSSSKNVLIWGKPITFVAASYVDDRGRRKQTKLVTSGFWGVARHMNYTFELLAAFFWCSAAGFNNAPAVYLYFGFLFVLLVHRTIRDEEKCRKKYRRYWKAYCAEVPFRLLPKIWYMRERCVLVFFSIHHQLEFMQSQQTKMSMEMRTSYSE